MNAVEWFLVIGLAMQMFHAREMNISTTYTWRWEKAETLGLWGSQQKKALVLELREVGQEQILLSFALVPWQDLYPMSSPDSMVAAINRILVAVSQDAIIYELPAEAAAVSRNNDAVKFFRDHLLDLISYERNTEAREFDACHSPEGIQIIRHREYPWYVEMEVAIPGSSAAEQLIPEGLPDDKMIHLLLVPDIGPVKEQWLDTRNGKTEDPCQQSHEYLGKKFLNSLETCLERAERSSCTDLYEELRSAIDATNMAPEDNHWKEYYFSMASKCLLIPSDVIPAWDMEGHFMDYQPKTTPDDVLDFRPGLAEEFNDIPIAQLENLKELVEQFREYRQKARKDPGTWEQGNALLGGREREYIPSNAELLLSETGQRIARILDDYKAEAILNRIKKDGIRSSKLVYTRFSFVHYDVMGSGRFFYVDEMEEMKIDLPSRK